MSKAKSSEAANVTPIVAAPPEGMRPIGLPPIDGWFKTESNVGKPVHGKLLGEKSFGRGDDARMVYLIELYAPVVAVSAEDKEVTVTLDAGQILGMSPSAKTRAFSTYKPGCDVWFMAKKKVMLKGGRTMWEMDVCVSADAELKTLDDLDRERAARVTQGECDGDVPDFG